MLRLFNTNQITCGAANIMNKYWLILLLMLYQTVSLHAQWIQQGPGPSKNGQVEGITDREITGAINCVAPHPANADILYIGGVNGGVWRTGNATAAAPAWTFISGDLTSQSIGALEFDPTDATRLTLVVGLGRTSSFNNIGSGARGIYRTTNGVAPWTNIDAGGTFATRNVTGIAARGATIVAASSSGGIFRTINTGGLWTQISNTPGTGLPTGGAFDLVSDPSNNAILYTNAGTNGIYKSVDTGANWTKVSDAAMDADLVGAGNLELSVGNADNVFVAIVRGGRLADLYRSGNGGTSWTGMDLPTTTEGVTVNGIHVGGQGNKHLSLTADPSNNNVVYIGGDLQPQPFPNSLGAVNFTGRLFRVDASLALGSQATSITHSGTAGNSSPHADSRDMDFDANGDLIESDDGGVYKQTSPEDATGNWFSLNGNINVTETHSSDWDANSNIIIVGAQDNAVTQQELPSNSKWKNLSNGDGGDVAIDDISSTVTSARYFSNQDLLNFRKHVYSTGNVFVSQTSPALIDVATTLRIANFSFVTPVKINSQNGSRLLIATTGGLFESTDQGATVTNIGAFTVNNFGADAIAYGAVGNANMLYVGVGNTVRIRSAAPPAAVNTSAAYPGVAQVNGVVMDKDDAQSAYVIDATHVFETTNGGGAWADRTGNLLTGFAPGTLRSIAYIPNSTDDILAVGTDLGVFIAPGPAFNTWARLGTNLPNVAVYDLEYDTQDEILLAATMGRGTWTFNFSERDPVDVALVLDISGSMLSNACATCQPKINVLKDAVEIFMQLWKGLAVTDDRIGSVYFSTNVNNYEVGGNTLLSVINETDNMIADVRAKSAGGSTAMGGGLQAAINELTDATRPRNIILFTDGMQNVDPGVDFPTLTIQDGEFGPNSNISASTPATVLNTTLDIKVNTVGVGATSAFETQLSQIAAGTNGITKITTAPDEDLRQFFVEELVDVLRAASPQLVAYRKGKINDVTTESFSINESVKAVIFKVSYQRGDKMAINIIKGNTDVTQMAKIINGPFYQIFSFPYEQLLLLDSTIYDGAWKVQMRGKTNISYELAAIADEASLEYKLSIDNKLYNVGEALNLSAQVLVNEELITDDVTVTATVKRPNEGLGTLLSITPMPANTTGITLEPNLPIGAMKLTLLSQNAAFVNRMRPVESNATLTPDAGRTFRSDFTNTNIPGIYTITYFIKGNHPFTGAFERIEQRTVNVKFAKFDYNASNVNIKKDGPKSDGKTIWTWSFTPKDKFKNFLGPDYGDVMSIKTTDGTVKNVKDIGDGTYEIEILSTENKKPKLTLGLYDEIWYDDLLPDAQQIKKWWASIHAGLGMPQGDFAKTFDAGIYWKIDLERRFNKNLAAQLTGGVYSFKKDLSIGFGVLQVKGYLPVSAKLNLFGEAGGGVFAVKDADAYFGIDAGLGLDYQLGSCCRLSFGGNYISLFNNPSNFSWLALGLGFHYGF